jgi:hypothetical protein
MSEKNYSKREIDQKFEQSGKLSESFEADIRQALTRIETQTSMTNGRVTRLERWQSYVVGFCACVSLILFSAVIPIISAWVGAH